VRHFAETEPNPMPQHLRAPVYGWIWSQPTRSPALRCGRAHSGRALRGSASAQVAPHPGAGLQGWVGGRCPRASRAWCNGFEAEPSSGETATSASRSDPRARRIHAHPTAPALQTILAKAPRHRRERHGVNYLRMLLIRRVLRR